MDQDVIDPDVVNEGGATPDISRPPFRDPTKIRIRDLVTDLTVPQFWGSIGALALLVVGSFMLGKNVGEWSGSRQGDASSKTANTSSRNGNTNIGGTIEPTKKPKVKVVFVDSTVHIYDKVDGRANAYFLRDQIINDTYNQGFNRVIDPDVATTYEGAPAHAVSPEALAGVVERLKPDLVVVHRSTFLPDPSETKLAKFLTTIEGSGRIFVVYSRRDDTDGQYAADLATRTIRRIYSYRFRNTPNPFTHSDQVTHFLNTVLLLAKAQAWIDQEHQASTAVPPAP